MKHTVYIVQCSDNTLYTGYALDIDKRLLEHNAGIKGAKYTRSRRPVTVVYTEHFRKKGGALKREAEIKKLSRDKKLMIIKMLTRIHKTS